MANGILFQDGDIVFKDGDIATGDTKEQCVDVLLNSSKGSNSMYPKKGIQSAKYTESQSPVETLKNNINRELVGDGMTVKKLDSMVVDKQTMIIIEV